MTALEKQTISLKDELGGSARTRMLLGRVAAGSLFLTGAALAGICTYNVLSLPQEDDAEPTNIMESVTLMNDAQYRQDQLQINGQIALASAAVLSAAVGMHLLVDNRYFSSLSSSEEVS